MAEASPLGPGLRPPQDMTCLPLEKSPGLNVFLSSLQAQRAGSASTDRAGQRLRGASGSEAKPPEREVDDQSAKGVIFRKHHSGHSAHPVPGAASPHVTELTRPHG